MRRFTSDFLAHPFAPIRSCYAKKAYRPFAVLLACLLFWQVSPVWSQVDSNYQWVWMRGDTIPGAHYGIYGVQGIQASANQPGSRGGSFGWQDTSGNFYLFGGGGYAGGASGSLSDLWKYNTAANEWTWLSGDSTVNQLGRYGAKGVPDIRNNPGGRYGAQSWQDGKGNLYLFGGYGLGAQNRGALNDLWKYNLATNEWTWLTGDSLPNAISVYGTQGVPDSKNTPGARYACFYWQEGGYFWLMGGTARGRNSSGGTGEGEMNDLWRYDPETNEWAWMKGDTVIKPSAVRGIKGTPDMQNKPGGLGSGVSWSDSGNLYLFGGDSYTGGANHNARERWCDVWRYHIATNSWTWMNGSGLPDELPVYGTMGVPAANNTPGARGLMPLSWTGQHGNFYLYGGEGPNGLRSDLWKYQTATNEWTWIKGSNSAGMASGRYGVQGVADSLNQPGAREFAPTGWIRHLAGSQGDELWLFGGRSKSTGQGNLNDLWRLFYDCSVYGGMLTEVNLDTVVCGSSFTLNGQTYDESGRYVQRSYDGCDTLLLHIDLTIETLHAIINVDGFTLGTQVYTTYQWLLNDNIIPGAVNRTYTVTQNGDYRVVVTNDAGCIDTSDVYRVTNAGVHDAKAMAQDIKVYPNPVRDVVFIDAPVAVDVTVTSIEGKVIRRHRDVSQLELKQLSSGMYFLLVTDQKGRLLKVQKVVKQ